MIPSTVQTSRFSFFSRETILAFAPCSTASTRGIESFQRNPNGGTSSSAARACCSEKKQTSSVAKTIRRIIGRFQRAMHKESRPMISVSVCCICNLPSVFPPLPEAGKLRAQATSVNSEMPHRIEHPNQFVLQLGMHRSSARTKNLSKRSVCFLSWGHTRSVFLVKKIFSLQLKIKLIFFLSISQRISSLKPAGESSHKARVNKL